MRPWLFILLTIVPGVIGIILFGTWTFIEYAELKHAYALFDQAWHAGDFNNSMITVANQNSLRIDVFADGVWTLLSALLAAIGFHGLYVNSSKVK